jgi:hypothetical protein
MSLRRAAAMTQINSRRASYPRGACAGAPQPPQGTAPGRVGWCKVRSAREHAMHWFVCRIFAALVVVLVAGSHAAAQQDGAAGPGDPGWRTFSDPSFGTRVEFPAGLFSAAAGRPQQGEGQRFRTGDGRAELSIYSMPRQGHTPTSFLRSNLQVSRESLHYRRVARNFFAVSADHQGSTYYSRCNFSQAAIHCIYVVYPRAEKRAWDGIVTRISRTLRPL